MFAFAKARRARRPSLTPMIDVVFLLLVFFMLAARFGQDGALSITTAGGSGAYSGPPRLVDVMPDGVRLNGVAVDPVALVEGLRGLVSGGDDMIVLRAVGGADLQRLVDVIGPLGAAGLSRLVVVGE